MGIFCAIYKINTVNGETTKALIFNTLSAVALMFGQFALGDSLINFAVSVSFMAGE